MDTLPEISDLQPIAALTPLEIPVIETLGPEGRSGPAPKFFREAIDLNEILIRHPGHTCFGIAWSDSMEPKIPEGSIVIVNQKTQIYDGKFVVVELDGSLCMKRYVREYGKIKLFSENPNYPAITVTDQMDVKVFGQITHVINFL